MIKSVAPFFLVVATAVNCPAAERSLNLMSDGTIEEIQLRGVKGLAEITFPGNMMAGTLQITPLHGAEINRVEMLPPRMDRNILKELELLQEKKNRQEERLKALSAREQIFVAAAKSQSAKTPRKTKTNPDPMQSIRQGTDYAITSLEAVYTAGRKATEEMRRLEERIAEIRKSASGGGGGARIRITPPNGMMTIRFATSGNGWTPFYDIRFHAPGDAELTFYGLAAGLPSGARITASQGSVAEFGKSEKVAPAYSGVFRFGRYRLPVSDVRMSGFPANDIYFRITNSTHSYLPSGKAAIYSRGEYRGELRFEGMSSGRSVVVSK